MSDSVDRVFSHAISTVNKIPIGPEKPPAKTVLRLYGLYKQSMEGDVEGLMVRPTGSDTAATQTRDKWDAWKACAGLSRTEAKRRYITNLISSMRQYASSSPDSRALVDELEFVWDQVKSNVSSSASSSPTHPRSGSLDPNDKLGMSRSRLSESTKIDPSQSQQSDLRGKSSATRTKGARFAPNTRLGTGAGLRHLTGSPISQSAVDDSSSDDDGEGEEFVDAPDSQIAEPPPRFDSPSESRHIKSKERAGIMSPDTEKDTEKAVSVTNTDATRSRPSLSSDADTKKWRRRVSTALIRLTAEVAALREQVEARRVWSVRSRPFSSNSFLSAIWSAGTFLLKHIAVDLVFFFFLLVWLRRKKDGRLEGAVRVLLGDAVAQVQKVGTGVQREVIKGVGKALTVAGAGTGRKGVTLGSRSH